MLISSIENFVLISTIIAIVCFAFTRTLNFAATRKLLRFSTESLIRIYTWALLLPPLFAAWIVAAAFLPQWWVPEAFDAAHTTPHEFHLVGDLTARLEPTLAYMLLLFAVCACLFAAISGWHSYMRVGRLIKKLQTDAQAPEPRQIAAVEEAARRYEFEVGLVPSNYPFSFVWGFNRSKLVVSTGLLRTLTPGELAGLLEHEAAHHQRRDNLIKLALSFCSYTSLAFPLTRRLLRLRGQEIERLCDAIAAARTKAPLDIASALVKLRRQTAPAPATVSSFVAEDVSSFHSRVSRLIELADGNPVLHSPQVLQNRMWRTIAFGFFFIGSLLVCTYFFPHSFHQTAESLIQPFHLTHQ